jgi:chemotaxis protein CheD
MDINQVRVGIADLKVSLSPSVIITIGLGSCIGITFFDKSKGIGGLSHIMLPDSTLFATVNNPLKFADLAVPILLEDMIKLGATKNNLIAKIAGGASMFSFSDKSMIMDVGNRNIIAVKNILNKLAIPIVSEDTGGNKGRTILLDTATGVLQIKTVGVGIKEI